MLKAVAQDDNGRRSILIEVNSNFQRFFNPSSHAALMYGKATAEFQATLYTPRWYTRGANYIIRPWSSNGSNSMATRVCYVEEE